MSYLSQQLEFVNLILQSKAGIPSQYRLQQNPVFN